MLALSIKQPWAWLIVNGYKDIENREWSTSIRGRVKVHAGKTFDRDGYEFVREEFPEIPLPKPNEFDRGGIVGAVNIVDCVKYSSSPWFFGTFGFVLENGEPSQFVSYRGQLGFFRA